MTRDEVITLLEARDPIAAAHGIRRPGEINWMRADDAGDGAVPIRYGAGTTPGEVADQLLAVAERADEVHAVHLVPGADAPDRPGSWGTEDLLVTAVARRVLPDTPIRPDWRALGAGACQVAVAFGADEWVIPTDDPSDPDHLAEAVGARAVPR